MPNKIKVPGYSQKVFYNDGIEYRNFSESLVGNQFTEGGGTTLFTLGNFSITTNMDPKVDNNFNIGSFSQYYTLFNLSTTIEESQFLFNANNNVILNPNKSNLLTYAYFGSLSEFIRVSVENIISTWPASIHITPIYTETNGNQSPVYTVTNYQYDIVTNSSTFTIPRLSIVNDYGLNYLTNGYTLSAYTGSNTIRNLTANYLKYVLTYNNVDYNIVGLTGLTQYNIGNLRVSVFGNPFNTSPLYTEYHIKPNKTERDSYFANLNDFEGYLLNTLIKPQYTSTFQYIIDGDDGTPLQQTKTITWPTTDGYNLDFNTDEYATYIGKLIEIAENSDAYRTDLIVRFLVSGSITDFDTIATYNQTLENSNADQKVSKLLRVYGRNFDDIKKYIDGIANANVITYDNQDNAPNVTIKNIAHIIGWDLTSSILENDLLQTYINRPRSSYSGYTRGLTPIEAEYEMWRRLILNSPWIWKSKGTRKVIEFLIKFIGAPTGLMTFNEHVYVAENKLDIDLIKKVLNENNLSDDVTNEYNIDADGYPRINRDTPDMYYQKGGGWYRETGGQNASTYVLKGNNPHVGPYDRGQEYIDQFRGLIPNFTPTTIIEEIFQNGEQALFTNYNQGTVNNIELSAQTYIDLASEGYDFSDCVVLNSYIIDDPKPTNEINDCGCDIATNDKAIKIDINYSAKTLNCDEIILYTAGTTPYNTNGYVETISLNEYNSTNGYWVFQYPQYGVNGTAVSPAFYNSPFINPNCCKLKAGGYSIPYYDIDPTLNIQGSVVEQEDAALELFSNTPNDITDQPFVGFMSGYICCVIDNDDDDLPKEACINYAVCTWRLYGSNQNNYTYNNYFDTATIYIDGERYLRFVTPTGDVRVVTPTGSNCIQPHTAPTNGILDPYTGEYGYGCKIPYGTTALNIYIKNTYWGRFIGQIGCSSTYELPTTGGVTNENG